MSMSSTFELDQEQTELWESDSPEGESFRKALRTRPTHSRHVEVRSHDGITLDAWENWLSDKEAAQVLATAKPFLGRE